MIGAINNSFEKFVSDNYHKIGEYDVIHYWNEHNPDKKWHICYAGRTPIYPSVAIEERTGHECTDSEDANTYRIRALYRYYHAQIWLTTDQYDTVEEVKYKILRKRYDRNIKR